MKNVLGFDQYGRSFFTRDFRLFKIRSITICRIFFVSSESIADMKMELRIRLFHLLLVFPN